MENKLTSFKGIRPQIADNVYIADGARIVGDVTVGENSSIWFNCVLRGDVAPIIIGKNSNIQDGTVIHTSRFDGKAHIGSNVTIGHIALIHACTIEDNAFVGMQATIMDEAIIEEFAFVAASSLVTTGKVVKSRQLWAGNPARFVRMITEDELAVMQGNVSNYIELAKEYNKDRQS